MAANGRQAAIIQDKIFLDGGDISWLPGLKNGSYGQLTGSGTQSAHVYYSGRRLHMLIHCY